MNKKLVSLVLTFSYLNLLFCVSGCSKDEDKKEEPHQAPSAEYHGSPVTVGTDTEGKVRISSTSLDSMANTVTYEIQVVNESGAPVGNMTVAYEELEGKSLIIVSDPNQGPVYTSALLYGTYSELQQQNGVPNTDGYRAEFVILIPLLIAVVALTVAELSIINHAYEIQKFYLSDYVRSEHDYVLYCKTYEQLADFLNQRIQAISNVKSIIMVFVTAGGSSAEVAVEHFARDWVIGQAQTRISSLITHYTGLRADQLTGRRIGV